MSDIKSAIDNYVTSVIKTLDAHLRQSMTAFYNDVIEENEKLTPEQFIEDYAKHYILDDIESILGDIKPQ